MKPRFLGAMTFLALFVSLTFTTFAQTTFNGTGTGAIPDGTVCGTAGTPIVVSFAVTGISGAPANISVGLNLTHTWVGDIAVTLRSPNGTAFLIYSNTGSTTGTDAGDSSNLAGLYTYNDAATTGWWAAAASVGDTVAVPTGTFRTSAAGGAGGTGAATNLTAAFAGIPTSDGTWTASITDRCPQDIGTITAATLTLTAAGTPPPTPTPPSTDAPVDMNADGKSDYVVARNIGGGPTGQLRWFILQNGTFSNYDWGTASDFVTPGDFDGDFKDDIAVWRAGTQAQFFVLKTSNYTYIAQDFGQSGDDPSVIADYDGDGRDDYAVFRPGVNVGDPSNWYYYNIGNSSFTTVSWGQAGDFPAPGDYDGDGKADFVVQRADGANSRYYRFFAVGGIDDVSFGLAGDVIVPGDYDGDGKTDIAALRNSGGSLAWDIRRSSDGGTTSTTWGSNATDFPAQGDYDGDGKTDVAVWRAGAQGTYFVIRSSDSTFSTQDWGVSGDYPVNNYNVH